MATTRIIPMHINKGKTIAQCMKARIDYVKNPDKTEDGGFISSYACAPESADHEFLMARDEYISRIGSGKQNEVIAYQLRQSFKPGEVSAEEANQIGYELAERLLHGEHAFIVATHTDRKHVHNHIVFCATALDCSHKFRNVWNSSRLVAEISDELCREHHLSVVQNPQNKTVSYEKWEGDQSKLTSRDSLRITIDEALRMQPDGFDALMQLMEESGCWIKRGAHVSIKPPGGERYIRLDSLGAEYSEAKLRKVLDGLHVHIPKIPRSEYNYSQVKRLIDVEAKLREGKGKGYMIWAERNNIDAKAQSIIFLKEHNIGSIEELEDQIDALRSERNALHSSIREKKNRMKEINELRQAIRDYRRTKDVYAQYKASGWSPKFYNEHRKDIEAHKKANIQLLTMTTDERSIIAPFIRQDGGYRFRSSTIPFTTCRKFKGLEADAVILLDVDRSVFDDFNTKCNFYVGTSRARLALRIVSTLSMDSCKEIAAEKQLPKTSKNPQKVIANYFQCGLKKIEQ